MYPELREEYDKWCTDIEDTDGMILTYAEWLEVHVHNLRYIVDSYQTPPQDESLRISSPNPYNF